MERDRIDERGEECGPPELLFTTRKVTAEAATSRPFSVRLWYLTARACPFFMLQPSWPQYGSTTRCQTGCVTSPWLFNLFMDSCLYDLKEYECGLRMDELSAKCLQYADDQVILTPLAYGPQEIKVMVFEKGARD
ncbi:hypothetical protein EVAR_51881_1 [Eumeta japonica]|uniref:Reverse transcriptase domain-containing protein n=1 Tax=Eumeta variegata TaxID=151549 RepID=A0A4C1YNP8_EUMVA|nr:hypothetical protein EVAR_51881_1 [Eumeta japonica]